MDKKDEPNDKEADRVKANGLHKTTSLGLNEVIKVSEQTKSPRAQVETHPAKIVQVERSEK